MNRAARSAPLARRPAAAAPLDSTLDAAMLRLEAGPDGLSSAQAMERLGQHGANRLRDDDGRHPLAILVRQFRSPMVLILLGAAFLSLLLGEADEAIIVGVIVLASTGLGFVQEYRAGNAVAELRRRMAVTSLVRRDGQDIEIASTQIVPGDVLVLKAGSLIPADALVITANALNVDEAALTGESFPVVKTAAAGAAPLVVANRLRMGTSVRSGEGVALVTQTGIRTEYGSIATAVASIEPETSFARGTRRFGLLMTQIMFILVTLVLIANVLLGRPVLDSLLFAAALAVGITPELLPAIVTMTLSQGARRLTQVGVLVRRLVAIENLGAMDVLCTDKTGTLTVGDVALEAAVDVTGAASAEVLRWAVLNAALQTALPNPLDTAVLARRSEVDLTGCVKRGEIPYDFERKRLSIIVEAGTAQTLTCKGAASSVLAACTSIGRPGSAEPMTEARRTEEERRVANWGNEGKRVLAVALKPANNLTTAGPGDEAGLTLLGYLLFADPLKPGMAATVAALARNGIDLKIISGDNRYVAEHVARAVGLQPSTLAGADLDGLGGVALTHRILAANVFAEVTPVQKERIVGALRGAGHTVGYMGDGINDAPSLRAADIGISVDNAVDAAKAAADVILLRQDLGVLLDGILAGRLSFGNTIKYIAITISANFGNMISMAAASLLLPFLPMLAAQILLNNLLTDLPMLAISNDRLDPELVALPRQWNFRSLIRSMLGFGLVSSAFDVLTFVVLLVGFHASPATFQTAWFVESLLTELAVVAVMRTQKPFFRSMPAPLLVWLSVAVALAAAVLPYMSFGQALFGFVPLSPAVLGALSAIVLAYVAASEVLKRRIGVLTAPGPQAAG